VLDERLRVLRRAYRKLTQHYPRPGWVEHDADEIWHGVVEAAEEALAGERPAAIGITNQRETTVVWNRSTGVPVAPAIVWQDRRTAERCASLPADLLRDRTGLVPDPYFSATKLEWLLERHDGHLCFGTVDSWLMWRMTGGDVHATDATNASRTLLSDLATGDWDDELLALFGVSRDVLPAIVPSCGVVGEWAGAPIAGVAGDQQAALFGQACFEPGQAKATYGTGTFVLVNVGADASPPPHGLLKTAAAAPGRYALEGAVLVAGAGVEWLQEIGVVGEAAETDALARSVDSTEGVHFVPALTGLGSPQWDPQARGLLTGLTRGTTRAHLARAALEAMAFQVADVLDAYPGELDVLRADGGASDNDFLMQFQADLISVPVEVAAERETTALGAAALAGLGVGLWDDVRPFLRPGRRFEPRMSRDESASRRYEWQLALRRAMLHA
jgi:glycerol kinase